MLDFIHCTSFSSGNLLDICQGVEVVGFIPSVGLLIKVVQDILCDKFNALRDHKGLFTVNIPYFLVINVRIRVHCFDVVYTERKDVLIIDGIHNGVGMQLIAKGLFGCEEVRILDRTGID